MFRFLSWRQPYSADVGNIAEYVRGGRGQMKLLTMHPPLAALMRACWEYVPAARPSFEAIVSIHCSTLSL
jgi:hypothetical protein